MCGHVGVATSDMQVDYLKIFNDLLYFDAVRGWDATGVAAVSRKSNRAVNVYKKATSAINFIGTKGYDRQVTTGAKLLLGHNRAATKGKVIDSNSHPFRHGRITMAHNGTLWRHEHLPRIGKRGPFEVDSEAICHALSVERDPIEVLEDLDGAFALVWYDQKDDTLNFARNDERPLYYAYSDDKKTMFWGSEQHMLLAGVKRHLKRHFTVEELPVGEHRIFDMDAIDFSSPEKTKFSAGYGASDWGNWSRVPYEPKRTSREMLKDWGMAEGEKVYVEVETFKSHMNNIERGTAYGYEAISGLPAVIHGVAANDCREAGSVITGSVSYMSASAGTGNDTYPAVVVSGNSTKVSDEEVKAFIDKTSVYRGFGTPASFTRSDETVGQLLLTLNDGAAIAIDQFNSMAAQGCGWCSHPLTTADADSCITVGDSVMHVECHKYYLKSFN